MANYELMLILDPNVSEEEKTSGLATVKTILTNAWAEVKKEDIWWDRKLAYKINNRERWFYVLLELELNWEKIKEISSEINLNRNIWRYMFVKQDS